MIDRVSGDPAASVARTPVLIWHLSPAIRSIPDTAVWTSAKERSEGPWSRRRMLVTPSNADPGEVLPCWINRGEERAASNASCNLLEPDADPEPNRSLVPGTPRMFFRSPLVIRTGPLVESIPWRARVQESSVRSASAKASQTADVEGVPGKPLVADDGDGVADGMELPDGVLGQFRPSLSLEGEGHPDTGGDRDSVRLGVNGERGQKERGGLPAKSAAKHDGGGPRDGLAEDLVNGQESVGGIVGRDDQSVPDDRARQATRDRCSRQEGP